MIFAFQKNPLFSIVFSMHSDKILFRKYMTKFEKIKKRVNNYLFNHYRLRLFLEHLRTAFFAAFAAALFAFGFSCFVAAGSSDSITIVTGGVSGISQNVVLVLKHAGVGASSSTLQSIFYTALNVPILLFGFFFVGKKFAIYSAVNVVLSSVFIQFFPSIEFCQDIASILSDNLMKTNLAVGEYYNFGGLILRLLFAAVCIGASSAFAFRGGFSCGGIDVITYYFSLRKSTNVGKYSIFVNGIIVLTYNILLISFEPSSAPMAVISLLLAVTYLFVSSLVVDFINVRNKKVKIQIITSNEKMADILISNFPHSATVVKGMGAFTKADRFTIFIVVSSTEVMPVVKLAKRVDPHVFITVSSLIQVYGKFYIKPVE